MFRIELKKKKYKEPKFKAVSFDPGALRFSFEKIIKKGIKRVVHQECDSSKVKHKISLQMLDLRCPRCGAFKLISFSQEEKLKVIRMAVEGEKGKIKLKDVIIVYEN